MTRLLKYIRLIKKKPSIAVRAGRAFVMANVFERKVLRGAEIAVTYRCQGKCDKCSCRSLIDESKPEMTTEQILKVCRKISSAGAILINLTGGEPLLREDIMVIIRQISKMPVLVSLTTNGFYLDRDLIRSLKLSGLDVIQLSLSSPLEEEHDKDIGLSGSYRKVLDSMEIAKSYGVEILINTVVTKDILYSKRIDALVAIARKYNSFLSLILPAQVGGWSDKDVSLNRGDYGVINKLLKNRFVTTDTESCYRKGMCPAGSEKVYISPYGDIYPCPFIQRSYGNVLEDDFIRLWRNMPFLMHKGCINIKDSSE